MPKVNIYGLPPKDLDDTKVVIFDNRTFNSSGAIRLFQGNPDSNGNVRCDIPKEYIGRKIRLVAMPKKYVYIGDVIDVSSLGAFHVVRLVPETNTIEYGSFPVNPDS